MRHADDDLATAKQREAAGDYKSGLELRRLAAALVLGRPDLGEKR